MELAHDGSLSRCSRCGKMYEEHDTAQTCYYHPGEYDNHLLNILTRTWSCCKEAEMNARGCTIAAGGHLRCEMTQKSLDTFAVAPGSSGLRRRKGGDDEPIKPAAALPPDDLKKYTCVVGDTIASVALRHKMRPQDLKRWNKLLTPNLFPGKVLLVGEPPPRPAAEVRAEAIRTLMRRGKVNQHEASYYLDEPGGGTDVAAALAALEADRAGSGEGEWVVVNSRDGVLAREMVKVELS